MFRGGCPEPTRRSQRRRAAFSPRAVPLRFPGHAGRRAFMLREMTDDLPTARTMAPTGFRVHVWCKACRHSLDADLDALIGSGKGDVPLVQLKWQCARCRSGLTDFVVSGAHFGPRRA
jgi:hypothetical protein